VNSQIQKPAKPHKPIRTGIAAAMAVGVASVLLGMGGCSSQDINLYAADKPVLELRDYFNGSLDAYGVFTDRSGQVVKRFTVTMKGTWTGDDGLLDEDFVYSDGTTQKRIWRLKRLANGTYTGRADDVVGDAQGKQSGNAFNWTYTMALPVDGKVYHVQFDDWMYLMTDRVMLNKATMSKFGFRLGEVTLSFSKR
jgi:Protein of unknown function (DUF3833)